MIAAMLLVLCLLVGFIIDILIAGFLLSLGAVLAGIFAILAGMLILEVCLLILVLKM